jgi:hypothetical protein
MVRPSTLFWVLLFQTRSDQAHITLRLFQADSFLDKPYNLTIQPSALLSVGNNRVGRDPEVCLVGKLETGWQDTNHHQRSSVHPNRLAKGIATSSKATLPKSMTGENGAAAPRRRLFWCKRPADEWFQIKNMKELR